MAGTWSRLQLGITYLHRQRGGLIEVCAVTFQEVTRCGIAACSRFLSVFCDERFVCENLLRIYATFNKAALHRKLLGELNYGFYQLRITPALQEAQIKA
jgi:hypothetical protein